MRKTIFPVIFCLSFFISNSQEVSVSRTAMTIPEDLRQNASAVYRLDKASLIINSASDYTLSVHQVVTLLNAQAAEHLHHQLSTDKFYKVDDVEIKVYNELGVQVKKYGKKDFEVTAHHDGTSLVTDNNVMRLYTPAPGYPCTLEVQYRIKASAYIELPNWFINYNNASTELFRYEVTVPTELDIRHRTLNLNISPEIQVLEKQKKYVWEAKSIKAKKAEANGFEWAKYLPQVEVAPNAFAYDGYNGSFKTWKDFGAWNFKLYEDKEPFTEQRRNEIRTLVSAANSREEKINILYSYMQQNMRYVSIQLGIGGFKPFAVKFVDEKKYGDCKALTNYMRYLLKEAGISSYPALINAGNNKIPVDPQFPSDPFNHVILCIPGEKDTVWLECTSNTNRAGELGGFTENKRALLITEQGGILVNTPNSVYENNRMTLYNHVELNADGGAMIKGKITSSGATVSWLQYVAQQKDDEQKESLIDYFNYKHPEELKVAAVKEQRASLEVHRFYQRLYEFNAGSKYFFPLTVNKLGNESLKPAKREIEFVFSHPYEKTDTTTFHLPENFSPESIPGNKELSSEYSIYKRTVNYDKASRKLTVTSYIALKNHVIPAGAYLAIVEFFQKVAEAESENMVLVKQQGSI